MTSKLSFEIHEAFISACGKVFWLKDPFRAFFLSCGVSEGTYERYSDFSKYKIARNVLADLEHMGDEGYQIQRRLITNLCKMRTLPDENVQDKDSAYSALRKLKELALSQKLEIENSFQKDGQRLQEAQRKQTALEARKLKMEQLRKSFSSMITSCDDPNTRGYALEDLIAELFETYEISYRRSYRTITEQIDGSFSYKNFDYLVESRWRKDPPSEADLGAFKNKVNKKFDSTRGIFVSIAGFRNEVVLEFTHGTSSNILLIDGQDLTYILEGRISLLDALDIKIQKAAQEGIIFLPLSKIS